jgi:ribokinase
VASAGPDVVVVGGMNTDFLVKGPELPAPGSTVEGDELHEGPGGKGANQAVAAARLGAKVAMVARVGPDERGAALLTALREEGVDVEAVVRDDEAPSGVALVMVDAAGNKQIMTAPGANRRLSSIDVRAAAVHIANAKVVLLQLEVPLEAVLEAISLGRAAGARIVLDPAPARPLPAEVLTSVHVLRPNAAEAEILTGIEVTDRASARRAAQNLLHRGVESAVIGAPGGNLLVSPEGEQWFPHLPVHSVDATGAGDAFAAALAVSIARGAGLAEATLFASAASALATTKVGAQAGLPRREEVESLLRRVQSGVG